MGVGLDPLRHLGLFGHSPLHRLNIKPLCHKRRPLSSSHTTLRLLQKAEIQTAGLHHDHRRLDQLCFNNSTAHVRMVSFYLQNENFRYKHLCEYVTSEKVKLLLPFNKSENSNLWMSGHLKRHAPPNRWRCWSRTVCLSPMKQFRPKLRHCG